MKYLILLALITLTGCAAPNLAGQRGDNLNTQYSLQDRRAAKLHVQVSDRIPDGATAIGNFSVQRCHQYAQDTAPSDAVLLDDLILLAYSEGADGLANAQYVRESGLLKNCWHIAKGSAAFYRKPK